MCGFSKNNVFKCRSVTYVIIKKTASIRTQYAFPFILNRDGITSLSVVLKFLYSDFIYLFLLSCNPPPLTEV